VRNPFKRNKYKCGACGASGCKLWREYGTYSAIILRCAPCAAKEQKRDISSIDENGMRLTPEYDWAGDRRSDQIGWYIPAVMTEEGDGYWGYTSVPPDSVEAWRKLPTLPKSPPKSRP
jgi:hypothetical protein